MLINEAPLGCALYPPHTLKKTFCVLAPISLDNVLQMFDETNTNSLTVENEHGAVKINFKLAAGEKPPVGELAN